MNGFNEIVVQPIRNKKTNQSDRRIALRKQRCTGDGCAPLAVM
jgi:hypothetical protein